MVVWATPNSRLWCPIMQLQAMDASKWIFYAPHERTHQGSHSTSDAQL
jgi:hypothetical protein